LNLPTEVTVAGTATTLYTYDSHGNVTSITDAMGDETTMTYYSNGLLETLTAPNGNVTDATGDYTTTYTYNEAGQVLTATTGLPSTVTNTYDDRGDLTSTTDADGNTTSYEYNVLGQLIQTTGPDPDGSGPETSAVSTIRYDPARMKSPQPIRLAIKPQLLATATPESSKSSTPTARLRPTHMTRSEISLSPPTSAAKRRNIYMILKTA